MRRSIVFVVLSVLVASSAAAQALRPSPQFEVKMEYAAALREGDVPKAVALHVPNPVLMPPDQKLVGGRADVEAYLQGLVERGKIELSIVSVGSSSSDALAFDAGTYELQISPPEGPRETERGKYLTVFSRDSEGSWLIWYDSWSRDEPPGVDE